MFTWSFVCEQDILRNPSLILRIKIRKKMAESVCLYTADEKSWQDALSMYDDALTLRAQKKNNQRERKELMVLDKW